MKTKFHKFTDEPEADVQQHFVQYFQDAFDLKTELGVGNNPVRTCIPAVQKLKSRITDLESEETKRDSHGVAGGTAAPVPVVSENIVNIE